MDLVLKRTEFKATGIFGELVGTGIITLERAYENDNPPAYNAWEPKLPPGTYTCKRGMHMLHSGPIETFEAMNVPGHSGILLHRGNRHTDSDGCVLLGLNRVEDTIEHSTAAFAKFMEMQAGINEFTLTVL